MELDPPVRQAFDLDVHEGELGVRVEEVGQSLGREPDPAVDPAIGQERVEPDERGVCDRIGLVNVLVGPLEVEGGGRGSWLHVAHVTQSTAADGRHNPTFVPGR